MILPARMPPHELLDKYVKTMVTQSMKDWIAGQTTPSRKESDVVRDALDFYKEHCDIMTADNEKAGAAGAPGQKVKYTRKRKLP